MFRLPRPTPASAGRRPPSPLRRAALFGGGLVCLWGALQLAPLPAEPPAEAPPAAVAPFPAVAPPVEAPPAESPAPGPVAEAAPDAAALPSDAPAEAPAAEPAAPAATPAPVATPAAAAAPPTTARPPAPLPASGRPASSGGGLFRFGNVVAFLLLAGGGAFAYTLHRKKRGVSAPAGAAPAMGVLGELSLGPGQAVRLVRVHDEVLVLGVAQTGVTLLHRYPYEALLAGASPAPASDPDADAPAGPVAGAGGHARLFADVLRQYVPASAHA